MGKSSSQVVGYRYFAKFAMFIGNRIEKLIAINFDNRKWVFHDPLKHPPNLLPVLEGNLFGENEGGVSGNVDIHFGTPDQEPNTEYQKYFPLVSGYPYQSYLVFRSLTGGALGLGKGLSPAGFYLGNSGYMKEMLLWVKRIHVKNDGEPQWHDDKSEVGVVKIYSMDASGITQGFFYLRAVKIERYPDRPENKVISTNEAYYDNGFFFKYGLIALGRSNYDIKDEGILGATHYGSYSIDVSRISGFVEIVYTVVKVAKSISVSWISGVEVLSDLLVSRTTSTNSEGLTSVTEKRVAIIDVTKSTVIGQEMSVSGGLVKSNGQTANILGSVYPELKPVQGVIQFRQLSGDINPIHKIREILTDDIAMAKPESDVNNDNFIKAADRIWDEGLGISWAIDEKSCIEAIEELCYHIEAGIRVNRQTGLYEMVLFRDNWFSENEIHDIAENKIKDLSLEIMNSDDIVNQLNVTYYDRPRIKNSTFSIYENGSILTKGYTNAESVEFPYFMNMRNAEIVANWKLKQFSTPAWSGSFTTGWREARKWNRYDLIRLPWSKKWNGTILVRIMKINLGDGVNNTLTIDFEEVIPYSGEMNTSIVLDAPVDSVPQPPQPSINAVFEAPYYLTVLRAGQTSVDVELSNNPDVGYVVAIAAKPQNNSLNALLYTDGGIGEFEQVSRLDYCDILQLDQPIIETTSSFTVIGSLAQAANSNNLILLNDELMGFVSFDDATKVLTVKRGVSDTVPKRHNSGSLFVFDFPDIAFDSTQYSQGEIVEAQVLTTTPSGIQELATNGKTIEIQSRAIRPYPPANLKFNDNYWIQSHVVSNNLVLTWSHRNRIQQTGGTHVGWYESSVTIEDGVTYSLEVSTTDGVVHTANNIDADTYMIDAADLTPNVPHKLKIWSVRDGLESLYRVEHNFFVEAVSLLLTATTDGSKVIGNTVPDANISVQIDESLKANIQFDGSGIHGKAPAGATITIEVEE